MSTAAVEVLDMLSQQTIDVDEALRLLLAIKKRARRQFRAMTPTPSANEVEVLMESVGLAQRSQFDYGNIIMK